MYQLLQGLANIMMIFGGTLIVLGMIALPFERQYKKKNGPLPKNTRIILYASLGFAALLITVPLKLFVFKPSRPHIPNIDFAYEPPDKKAQDQALKEAVNRMNEKIDKDLGIRRVELTPAEAERRRQLQAKEAEEEAERERRRQEERVRHAATLREAQERHAAIRRKMEETREMRKADFFRPPEGSTTPEQKVLDEKIVAANAELQDLKAEKLRLEEEADSAHEAYRDLIKSGVPDRAKLDELRTKSSEGRKAASEANRAIGEKRREVTSLLDERYDLI